MCITSMFADMGKIKKKVKWESLKKRLLLIDAPSNSIFISLNLTDFLIYSFELELFFILT